MDFKVLSSSTRNTIVKNGLAAASSINQEIGLFDYGNVLVRRDYLENSNVRIISGGAHYMGDLVGKGMLTVALQGDSAAAPASNIILRTLHELSFNHVMGSLIIVPCDTGCTLNFGLAIERALNDGLRLKMISVADNYCNDKQPRILQQALGGITLLLKIAGAMSEEERTLSQIHNLCERLCNHMVSSEIELPELFNSNPTCSCMCAEADPSIPKKIKEKTSATSIRVNLAHLINIVNEDAGDFRRDAKESATAKLILEPGDGVVVLINNNMALSKIETYFLVKEIMEYINVLDIIVLRFYIGDFVKIARANLSFTLMKVLDDEILGYLDAPTTAPGWVRMNQSEELLATDAYLTGVLKKTVRPEPPIRGPILSERAANILLFCMQFACSALISCERQLNTIDSDRGDGDTGTRMKTLAELLLKRIKNDKLILNYPFSFFDCMSKLLEKSLGGCSGCIYSILFEAAASVFGKHNELDEVTTNMWMEAFEAASEAVKRYGNVEFGEGTMYDPICAFINSAKENFEQKLDILTVFGKALQNAEEAIDATKQGGRYPDPGAHAVGVWMRAIYEGVKVRWPN